MNIPVLMRFFSIVGQMRKRDQWTRAELEAYQAQALQKLRQHAYAHSPFYQRHHKGLMDRPLSELPVLTKADMMANFDDLVTDRTIRIKEIDDYLLTFKGDERYRGRYWLNCTSGSTGRRGFFLFDSEEWATVVASFARAYSWAGHKVQLTRRIKLATVTSPTPWHMTARIRNTLPGWWTPSLAIPSTESIAANTSRLNTWQPEVIMASSNMIHPLAVEHANRNLHISPRLIFSGAGPLTAEARRAAERAWGPILYNQYGVTESGCLAAECTAHQGLHLLEDLVIVENVDAQNRPVPEGEYGERLLLTVLFNRTQPLIRYVLDDSVCLTTKPCTCGRSFTRVENIQGRAQDTLYFPSIQDTSVKIALKPIIFAQVMDRLAVGGWQIIQRKDQLRILLAEAQSQVSPDELKATLLEILTGQGIVVPQIDVERVLSIPPNQAGKTPLIKVDITNT